jgi:predicted metallopeptidase
MKRFLLWLLFFILTIYIFNSCSCERNNQQIESVDIYKKNNNIINHINNNYIESIVIVGLHELKIDSVTVNLYYLPTNLKNIVTNNNIFIVNALIIKNVEKNYSIFVNDNSINSDKLIKYIAHELIHLDQFNSKRLVVYDNLNVIRFDNKLYFTLETNYENRPWENEAFSKQEELKNRINAVLH